MSDTTDSAKTAINPGNDAVTEAAIEASPPLEENVYREPAKYKQNHGTHPESYSQPETVTTTTPEAEGQPIQVAAMGERPQEQTAEKDFGQDGDKTGDTRSAEEIEKEASEHLARRAAELRTKEETELSQPEQTHEETSKEFEKRPRPPTLEIPNDVPEAPQGTTEQTGAEIQTIMDQFREGSGLGEQDIMSPRLERAQPILKLPPRTSSLEPTEEQAMSPQGTGGSTKSQPFSPPVHKKGSSVSGASLNKVKSDDTESLHSSKAGSIFQPPPPSPDPEPAQPFDFHRFLEQLRHRTADPVARFLRSFLNEFAKKQWMVHEQVKIISDFLEFISKKMAQCEVWRTVSDVEFDNAKEGMEKLVMNRLYSQTFSPAIPSANNSPRKSGKSSRNPADAANPYGPGRRGQHQEDVERDEVIAQKIRIYGWIREEHLDMKPISEKGRRFLTLAQRELLKINTYRAPRDKVICVLNTCKVIFGFLKNSHADQSADSFVPLLIYTVLRAHPEHLVSNVQYIWRFRNQDKLGGEAGYYMSTLMGVVAFIENLDRTNLTISDEEFEINVEQAVSAIAETNKAEEYESKSHAGASSSPMPHLSEKSALSRPEVTPRNSSEAERASPKRNLSHRLNDNSQRGSNETPDDSDPVTGLLRTIQKPLSSIGRIFSDDAQNMRSPSTPMPEQQSARRMLSPGPRFESRPSQDGPPLPERPHAERKMTAADAAARQASAETAQMERVRNRENRVVVETLQSMFPNLDEEVIHDVVRAQEGNIGRAVDACLALSG